MPAPHDDRARQRLRAVEARISEIRDEIAAALTRRDEARDAFSAGDFGRDSDEYRAAEAAVSAVGSLREELADQQAIQVTLLESMGEDPNRADTVRSGDAPRQQFAEDEYGEAWHAGVLESPELIASLAEWAGTKSQRGSVRLGEIASKDALVADVTGTSNMRRGPYRGILPQLRRRIRLLDLIATGTMTGNSIPYTVESGDFTTARETSEGTTKPEATITLTDATASAATIAHWIKIQKQSLSDWPALRSIMDSRLRYGLLRRLEAEVLAGDGTGANMTGILNTAGIQTTTYTAGAAVTDQILKSITSIFLAEAEATAAAIHPTDWQRALFQRAQYPNSGTPTVGSMEYLGGGPFGSTPLTVWGIPLIPTAAVPQGTAVVGDWDLGAILLIREGVQVLLSDSDGSDFLLNRIALLAEMRAAFPVFRPAAFVAAQLGLSGS